MLETTKPQSSGLEWQEAFDWKLRNAGANWSWCRCVCCCCGADADTLALLTEKSRQATEAHAAAATAQQAISRLSLEQGARQAEAQEAARTLQALATLLPSPLPPVVAAFEGSSEDAKARLVELRGQLGAVQAFLQRARALEAGGELGRTLGALRGALAGRSGRPAFAGPGSISLEQAGAMVEAAVAAHGGDVVHKCEAAADAAGEMTAAAEAAVAVWVLPTLEGLQAELRGEVDAQSLKAAQLEQEIEGYKTLIMWVLQDGFSLAEPGRGAATRPNRDILRGHFSWLAGSLYPHAACCMDVDHCWGPGACWLDLGFCGGFLFRGLGELTLLSTAMQRGTWHAVLCPGAWLHYVWYTFPEILFEIGTIRTSPPSLPRPQAPALHPAAAPGRGGAA